MMKFLLVEFKNAQFLTDMVTLNHNHDTNNYHLIFSWKHVVILNLVLVGVCVVFAAFLPHIGKIIG